MLAAAVTRVGQTGSADDEARGTAAMTVTLERKAVVKKVDHAAVVITINTRGTEIDGHGTSPEQALAAVMTMIERTGCADDAQT